MASKRIEELDEVKDAKNSKSIVDKVKLLIYNQL